MPYKQERQRGSGVLIRNDNTNEMSFDPTLDENPYQETPGNNDADWDSSHDDLKY